MPPQTCIAALNASELAAARLLVARILDEVPAVLVQAALFGSKARGQSRSDSDVDMLLVFRDLPPDREPYAGHAEWVAEEIAAMTDVPVTVWSVSLADLEPGRRTPMLVDALADALPVWCWPEPLPSIPFTPADALRCTDALLARTEEGSVEFSEALAAGDPQRAARRVRDDIVRLCTALLLLDGVTRPRRATVIDECLRRGSIPDPLRSGAADLWSWVRHSFGDDGRDDDGPVPPPPCGPREVTGFVDALVAHVRAQARQLQSRTASDRWLEPAPPIPSSEL